jgi:hypothetical protein
MHRVLRDGGRVALSVWRGLDFHPFFATFNDAPVRQIGIPALASPFSLGDADRVCDLLTAAGFDSPVVDTRSMTARFPDPDEFIAMEIDVIAAAIPSVQHLDARAREALRAAIADELRAPIRAVTHDEHIVIPMHAHIVRAYRRAA